MTDLRSVLAEEVNEPPGAARRAGTGILENHLIGESRRISTSGSVQPRRFVREMNENYARATRAPG